MHKRKATSADMIGQRFGRLTVLARNNSRLPHNVTRLRAYWLCRCLCGKQTIVESSHLRNGHTQSCGCYKRDRIKKALTTHGHNPMGKPSSTHRAWSSMCTRCFNRNNPSWKNYGGRGITACERWKAFENFLADMGERPKGTSIDRINNDGNYEPGNCRWATRIQQARNTRRNHVITDGNGRRACLAEWAEIVGIMRETIACRLKIGVPVDQALNPTSMKKGYRLGIVEVA